MKYILLIIPLLLLGIVLPVSAQTTAPFQALFSNNSLEDWQYQNTQPEFFVLTNNTLQVSGDRGWLQSPNEYGDFILEGEFRFLEANADSGIFLRVEAGSDFIFGWPGDAYQVQIREISENTSDNPLPMANLYRHRVAEGNTVYDRDKVFNSYTGIGQWQALKIIVIASKLVVELNGEIVTSADNLVNASGFIGFQSEKGNIEYRNLMINEL